MSTSPRFELITTPVKEPVAAAPPTPSPGAGTWYLCSDWFLRGKSSEDRLGPELDLTQACCGFAFALPLLFSFSRRGLWLSICECDIMSVRIWSGHLHRRRTFSTNCRLRTQCCPKSLLVLVALPITFGRNKQRLPTSLQSRPLYSHALCTRPSQASTEQKKRDEMEREEQKKKEEADGLTLPDKQSAWAIWACGRPWP